MLASFRPSTVPATTHLVLAQAAPPAAPASPPSNPWVFGTGLMALALLGTIVYFHLEKTKMEKRLRMEEFRTRELKKRLDFALKDIHRMETNPDLVDSREFNLDYLRMRMQEETFHFAIVNQIKMKVKTLVSVALRPPQQQVGLQQQPGDRNQARQVDHTFDVEHETHDGKKTNKRVLFRIQIRLAKLPTQPTSKTIEEIIKCMERYLSLGDDEDEHWQPTLQGRLATMSWDQKAKPTPLLVLEQLKDGMNVTIRTRRAAAAEPEPPPARSVTAARKGTTQTGAQKGTQTGAQKGTGTQTGAKKTGQQRTTREATGGTAKPPKTRPAPGKPRDRA